MKQFILQLCIFIISLNYIYSQDCSGNRYYLPIFSQITEVNNIQYGSNIQHDGVTPVNLLVDIYYPQNDTDTDRPLIILAHGGGFVEGNKNSLTSQCKALASLGYVTASIQYRLIDTDLITPANVAVEFQKGVIRAVHDMRSAVRFFRKSVEEDGNPYGINPDIIIVGGFSAGAVMANHTTYLDDLSKIPTDVESFTISNGGIEGNSGNDGFSSVPQMSLSMCGAIGDTLMIEAGDQPFLGIHNINDPTVPNLSGYPNIGFVIPVMLYGDSLIHKRALNIGVTSTYMSVPTSGHCDFPASTANFIIDFVHDNICAQNLSLQSKNGSILVSIYPNPSDDIFYIDVPSNKWNWEVSIVNSLGKTIEQVMMHNNQNLLEINTSNYNSGIYLVKLKSDNGQETIKKLVIK